MKNGAENILVCVAWPYVNGEPHLGHIAGNNLPADIFARFHRMIGNNVLMVSGSDQHGTPVTLRANEENTTPEKIAEKYHFDLAKISPCWEPRRHIAGSLCTVTVAKTVLGLAA